MVFTPVPDPTPDCTEYDIARDDIGLVTQVVEVLDPWTTEPPATDPVVILTDLEEDTYMNVVTTWPSGTYLNCDIADMPAPDVGTRHRVRVHWQHNSGQASQILISLHHRIANGFGFYGSPSWHYRLDDSTGFPWETFDWDIPDEIVALITDYDDLAIQVAVIPYAGNTVNFDLAYAYLLLGNGAEYACGGGNPPEPAGGFTPVDTPPVPVWPYDQYLRPIGKLLDGVRPNYGWWHTPACGLVDTYEQINDGSDLTYIRNACDQYAPELNSTVQAFYTLDVPEETPENPVGVTLNVRVYIEQLIGGNNYYFLWGLYEGGPTVDDVARIFYALETNPGFGWHDFVYELSEAEFNSISDFGALSIRIGAVADSPGVSTATLFRCTNAYVFFPA